MSKGRIRGEAIRRFILEHIEKHSVNISQETAKHFAITRQAVNKHLQRLVAEGAISEVGHTKNRIYKLATVLEWKKAYPITPASVEDVVWRNDIEPILGSMPENVFDIWHYGFTEMFNNAIDHSEGSQISVSIKKPR